MLCPSVLVRLQFKFFILTFCPSVTTANSGLLKRQGAKNRFIAHVLRTVLYWTVLVHIEDVRTPLTASVTDGQTDIMKGLWAF